MKRAWWLLVPLAAGCGAGTTELAPEGPSSRREAGIEIALVPAPTPGAVDVAIVIDAGTRDAEAPQIATVAAWIAGDRVGIEPEVTPEGTAFRTTCPSDALAECVGALAPIFSRDTPSASAIEAARVRLTEARGRAPTSPRAEVELAAIEALFGDRANAFLSFGRAEDDSRVDASSVGAFVAACYGRHRILLALAGDATDATATAAARALGEHLADARAPVAPRGIAPESNVVARAGATRGTSAAALFPDESDAWWTAERLDALSTAAGAPAPFASVMPLRGGVLLVASSPRADDAAFVLRIARAIDRARVPRADLPRSSAPPGPRELGLRWVARGGEMLAEPVVAIASIAPADDAPPPRGRGERDAPSERAIERIWREACDLVAARPHGDVDDARADVEAATGAFLRAVRRDDGRVAMTVRFVPGPGGDPPTMLGRAALAAESLRVACVGALGTHEDTRTLVEEDAVGAVVTWPAADGIDPAVAWLDCLLHLDPVASDVERARVRAIRRAQHAAAREAIAPALAPNRPGLVATDGTVEGLAHVRPIDVERALDELRHGRRVAVGWVGPLPIAEVVAELAPALGALDAGRPPEALEPGAALPLVVHDLLEAEPPRAIVGWIARTTEISAGGASAFAERAARRLGRAGFTVLGRAHGAAEGVVWATVEIRVPEPELDGAPARIREATRGARLPAAEARRVLLAGRLAEASPALLSRRLASGRGLDTEAAIAATFSALAAGEPSFAVLRAQPEGALRALGAR